MMRWPRSNRRRMRSMHSLMSPQRMARRRLPSAYPVSLFFPFYITPACARLFPCANVDTRATEAPIESGPNEMLGGIVIEISKVKIVTTSTFETPRRPNTLSYRGVTFYRMVSRRLLRSSAPQQLFGSNSRPCSRGWCSCTDAPRRAWMRSRCVSDRHTSFY